MPEIHPAAIVDPRASIAADASIGAYCLVGGDVELSAGVELLPHVIVDGHTTLGAGCVVHPFAVIGGVPQDRKFSGEASRIIIGENTVIREHVTIHPGTKEGGMLTAIGKNCMVMIASHIAHDCHIGDNVTMANNVVLGGHCHIGDHVSIGGMTACHQHVRIGEHSYIGGASAVNRDIPPFTFATGSLVELHGINIVGLQRQGFSRETIHALRRAFRSILTGEGTLVSRLACHRAKAGEQKEAARFWQFIADGAKSENSIAPARTR